MNSVLLTVTLVASPQWWVDCAGSDRAIACARLNPSTQQCEVTIGGRYNAMDPRSQMDTLGHELYHCAYPHRPHPEPHDGIDLTSWIGYSTR